MKPRAAHATPTQIDHVLKESFAAGAAGSFVADRAGSVVKLASPFATRVAGKVMQTTVAPILNELQTWANQQIAREYDPNADYRFDGRRLLGTVVAAGLAALLTPEEHSTSAPSAKAAGGAGSQWASEPVGP